MARIAPMPVPARRRPHPGGRARRVLAVTVAVVAVLGQATAAPALEGATSHSRKGDDISGTEASGVLVTYDRSGNTNPRRVADSVDLGNGALGISQQATATGTGTVGVVFSQPVTSPVIRAVDFGEGLTALTNSTVVLTLTAVNGVASTTGVTLTAYDAVRLTVSGLTIAGATTATTANPGSGSVRITTPVPVTRLDFSTTVTRLNGVTTTADTFTMGGLLNEDLGDAPAAFDGTNAARHTLGRIWLGGAPTRDAESSFNPTTSPNAAAAGAAATGDTDDGVTSQPTLRTVPTGTTSTYTVGAAVNGTTGAAGVLSGWLDFDASTSFAATERADAGTVPVGSTPTLSWTVPTTLVPGRVVYQRLRLAAAAMSGPAGPAYDGEVEDTRLIVEPRLPVVTAPSEGTTSTSATVTVSGTGEPGGTITLREGATVLCTATVAAGGTWTCTPSALANGTHAVVATQVVNATGISDGTLVTAARTFTVAVPTPTADSVTVPQGVR